MQVNRKHTGAFPWQRQLREDATILRSAHIAFLVIKMPLTIGLTLASHLHAYTVFLKYMDPWTNKTPV